MEDPNIVMDLWHYNSGMKSQYDVLWDKCNKYLEESVGIQLWMVITMQVSHKLQVL